MMRQRYGAEPRSGLADVEAALAAMSADQLRDLIRAILPELDGRIRGVLVNNLKDWVDRAGSGWAPSGPSPAEMAAAAAFSVAAQRRGFADPEEVDLHLRQGTAAFRHRRYGDARAIFQALLPPLGEGEIDLGQDEPVAEVLRTDEMECVAQYLVAVYMTSEPEERAQALMAACSEVSGIAFFDEPLREMEAVAVEPLPGLAEFLPRWRDLLEEHAATGQLDWADDPDECLREVVQRVEGVDGLARIARATRRAHDLRAWCGSLVEAKEWPAALQAFEEAASIVREEYAQGRFLDGAALAAQEMGLKDLAARLESVWRKAPSLVRLRRWLGSLSGAAAIRKAAAEALETCPRMDVCEEGLLRLVTGDHMAAVRLLAKAPGLGWSDNDHPGYFLFPVFQRILTGGPAGDAGPWMPLWEGFEGEPGWSADDIDEPQLATPSALEVLRRAGAAEAPDGQARAAILEAMRQAAEQRLAGATGAKKRTVYGQAADLVLVCAALDRSSAGARWLADLRARYRRYPALRAELDARLG
ncbi:MAG: hypothetical protein AB1634_14940 [Thermodesulfobacteriota bacterium]